MSGRDEPGATGQTANTMTPAQSRAARALLDWSVADLARRVGLDASFVQKFERGTSDPASGQIEAMRSVLMTAGIVFTGGEEPGVRLRGRGGDEGTRLSDLTTENDL